MGLGLESIQKMSDPLFIFPTLEASCLKFGFKKLGFGEYLTKQQLLRLGSRLPKKLLKPNLPGI